MWGMQATTTTALLTIRAWCEEGSENPFRAQIRIATDVSSGFGPTMTVAFTESVMDAVRGFLEDILCSSPDTEGLSRRGHGVGSGWH
jgi:hypothetical protein